MAKHVAGKAFGMRKPLAAFLNSSSQPASTGVCAREYKEKTMFYNDQFYFSVMNSRLTAHTATECFNDF